MDLPARRADKGGDEPPLPLFHGTLCLATDQRGKLCRGHAASLTPSGSFAPVMKATASDML